ncbi:hypothetical protein ACOR62_06665 [Neisseria lisongii]|uniref:Uncharacterized protein n=1 Tax=Neisseria lisongii TaxID=2912188 RepID=A0AAW5ACY1_9NEIS|nr:hypothetical protein [Neisseria lisongii]MCF7528915.1 hypothetical protein [Neisseria lisongii]
MATASALAAVVLPALAASAAVLAAAAALAAASLLCLAVWAAFRLSATPVLDFCASANAAWAF